MAKDTVHPDYSIYRIRVEGRLNEDWGNWFSNLEITANGDETVLEGPVVDQSALMSILLKIADMNLKLVSVQTIAKSAGSREKR